MAEGSPRQLLLQRLRDKKRERLGEEGAIPRQGLTSAPLSFAQQRLWFLEQLEPGNARFNILTAVRARGEVHPPTLARALNAVVARHASLRTCFVSGEGEPIQRIVPRLSVPLPEVDLAGLAEERREGLLHAFVRQEAATPFDLARGPLTRGLFLRMGEGHRVLILSMHQIIVDRWSRGVLVRELTALYEAFLDGLPSPLPELPIQYADFAVWQRQWLTGPVLDRLLGYWQGELRGAPTVLELPTDRPRPPLSSDRGHMRYDVLPQADVERLQTTARRSGGEGTTLFVALWAAFAALLYRYTGQEDLTIGSPIANRNRKEIEGLIGFFVNMLPLRLQVTGQASFRDLLRAAQTAALGAYEHQDLPFERLVTELGVERDLSRHPVFQSTLTLQNTAMPPLALRRATLSLVEVDWGSTAFDLALFCWETRLWESLDAGLSLIASYSSELFDAATAIRLMGHFKTLLRAASATPERPVAELALLPAEERHQLLCEVRGGAHAVQDASLPARLAATTARFPDVLALDCADGRLSFGELLAAGRAVAAGLRQSGVPPASVVGLLAERGAVAVAGLLGILEAGCAYLPVETDDPPAHRDALLAEGGAVALLSPGPDGLGGPWRIEPLRSLPSQGSADLACILPTSGSSGRPRMVGLPHGAVLRLAFAGSLPALGPGDRVAQASRLSFDASLYEIWAPLLCGATVVGIGRDVLLSPSRLGGFLRAGGVSTLFLATALFHRLAGEEPALFGGLRELLVGGETVDPTAVRRVLAAGPPGRLFHVYGPTEGTTFSTACTLGRGEILAAGPEAGLPLGSPLAGTEVFLLDDALELAPLGCQGEVFLGGAGLARGYIGAPDRTADRFIPHLFAEQPGERLFHTGDLARRRPDGELEFRGRRDRQIKIRGMRLEPGQVEAALASHPGVVAARVVVRERRPGERDLVACFVPRAGRNGEEPGAADLAEHLKRILPAWMLPAAFLRLEELPLTANGKVDLTRLTVLARSTTDAGPAGEPAGRAGSPVAPRDDRERALAEVWAEVLGRQVGVFDDFFGLGGHSLHVIQVISRLRRLWGLELPVRRLFELPTVAALAPALEALGSRAPA